MDPLRRKKNPSTRAWLIEMDPLTRKKISRSALRNHAKKLQGDIDALLLNFPDDGARRLRTLKTNFEAQVTKINTSCDEIAALIDVEDILTKGSLQLPSRNT